MYIQLLATDLKMGTTDKQFLLKIMKLVVSSSAIFIKIIENLRNAKLVSDQKPFGAGVFLKSKRLDRFVS